MSLIAFADLCLETKFVRRLTIPVIIGWVEKERNCKVKVSLILFVLFWLKTQLICLLNIVQKGGNCVVSDSMGKHDL